MPKGAYAIAVRPLREDHAVGSQPTFPASSA